MNTRSLSQASDSFGYDAARRSTPRWHIARHRRLVGNGVIGEWRGEWRAAHNLDIVTAIFQDCLDSTATGASFAADAAAATLAAAFLLINVVGSGR